MHSGTHIPTRHALFVILAELEYRPASVNCFLWTEESRALLWAKEISSQVMCKGDLQGPVKEIDRGVVHRVRKPWKTQS